MDKLTRYREIIRQLIFDYASHKPANGQIDTEAVIDSERNDYEVLHIGWDGVRRVHGSVVHIDIINDKVWIQYDRTSEPVAEALLEAGILREDIVLGFHPAELRQYTDFAVS
ncbi:XisI protein [Nostoc sp. DedQUE07]|uniref:XisI protein n=1 Tax=Nostoc sp. DedQUE07 TaxID=3075392 RepID=UPI002AD3E265|nr:XisI protein [Nostoc sp. DedQUE07]MDZ8130157.1 XisI protein [Nostoc sp. DedQUE07]